MTALNQAILTNILAPNSGRAEALVHGDVLNTLSEDFRQTPNEAKLYQIDYTNFLASGETPSTLYVSVWPVTTPALSVSLATFANSKLVFLVSGGVNGTSYDITLAAHTTYQVLVDVLSVGVTTQAAVGSASPVAPYGFYLSTLLSSVSTVALGEISNNGGIYSLPTTPPAGSGTFWNDGHVLCVTSGGSLPTSIPGASGAFWSDGGVVCVTSGGANPLPTSLPVYPYRLWNRGGVVCIS